MTITYTTLQGNLFKLQIVENIKDNIFQAVHDSGLVQSTSCKEMKAQIERFINKDGSKIAEKLLIYLTQQFTLRNEIKYHKMTSEQGMIDDFFQLSMISLFYEINVVVLKSMLPEEIIDISKTLQSIMPEMTSNFTYPKTIWLLHYDFDKPHFRYGKENSHKLNCYGTVRKVDLSMHDQLFKYTKDLISSAVSKIHRQKFKTKWRKKNRKNGKIYPIEKIQNRIGKYNLRIKKATNGTEATETILNKLTESIMTEDEHSKLLEPASTDEIYFALNKFGKMMGEKFLPTRFCGVCACKYIPSKIERTPIDDVPNFILLALQPWHRTKDITGDWVLLNDALFERKSSKCVTEKDVVIKNISDCDLDICRMCKRELQDGKIPTRSLASFDTGPIPDSLKNIRLTFTERMFLAVNMSIFNIFRVENPGKRYMPLETKARVSKGHCISFKHSDTRDTIEKFILPHCPTTLPKLMVTSYIGQAASPEEAREMVRTNKQLTLRTHVVNQFAQEYARLNPKRIAYDDSRLKNHISGTVPEVILNMVNFEDMVERPDMERPSFIDMDDAMHDDYARRDMVRPEDHPDPNVQVVHSSGMVVPHMLSSGLDDLKNVALRKLYGSVLAIPTERNPASDYNERYFVDNYPNIFIHGVGERPSHVPLDIYLDTIMRRIKTGASTDFSFPFEARNVLLRQRTLKRVRLSMNVESSTVIPKIADEDFNAALLAIQSKQPVNDRVKVLLKQLQITGADLRGTPQRLNRYRQQILSGLYPLFGPFDVWITLNMQESSSQIVLRLAGEQDIPISYDIPEGIPQISRRMQICAENPMLVAEFFHIFMKGFLEGLLGLPYKKNDMTPTHKGIFGWVQAYMFILEVSGKATGPHAHGQIKVKGLNRRKLLERFHDPVFVDLYKKYLLATFSQDLPNERFDVIPSLQPGKDYDLNRSRRAQEETFRSVQPELISKCQHYMGMYPLRPLPLKQNVHGINESTEDYLAKRLVRIIRECGIHEHSATCAKNGHAGDDMDCRMSYPQPFCEDIEVDLDEYFDRNTKKLMVSGVDVKIPRDHPFVVAMNKWVTLATASNTAIHYMPSGREGRTKALYVTDYSTKKALSTYECISLFRASMQARRNRLAILNSKGESSNDAYISASTIVNRCLNALSGEVIITGYECCADILAYPDNYSSNTFVALSGWSYMYNMTGEESRQLLHIVPQENLDDGTMRTTLVSIIEDYIHLDIEDDLKMTAYEFTAFYKRERKKNNHMDVDNNEQDHGLAIKTMTPGRPKHVRINFKQSHKLHKTHCAVRVAKMRVPYQVGKQYPRRPKIIDDFSKDQQELYAKYVLAIFKPWSITMKPKLNSKISWWETLMDHMKSCPSWIPTVINNMQIALDRDETVVKCSNGTDRVSSNTMNHADSKFEFTNENDESFNLSPDEAAELLRDMEDEQRFKGMNLTRPSFTMDMQFVNSAMENVSSRFRMPDISEPVIFFSKTSSQSISEGNLSAKEIKSRLSRWKTALNKLISCNNDGTEYDMNDVPGIDKKIDPTFKEVSDKLCNFLMDPVFVTRPESDFDARFRRTESRPDWTILEEPPTILQTISAWHLTKKQAEFVTLVLNHFHMAQRTDKSEQLLAACLGAPGTGKSQTMKAIIWHMSQYNRHHSVGTCAFTGGAAMLIDTPYTRPMTTCRMFSINLKGPNNANRAIDMLVQRVGHLEYVFIDEFSFLSYRHLKHIAEQIAIALGSRAKKDRPFCGMNMIFFGDYEQLSKPGDYAMYYGAHAEQCLDPEGMNMWFAHEMKTHMKKSSYDPSITYLGRNLWTSINIIRTLTVQKRQENTESGPRLLQRCEILRDETFTDEFFDSLQRKAIGMECGPDIMSEAWSDPLYIVMRHAMRVPLDFSEASFQANKRSKRFLCWRTIDIVLNKPLPKPLQLVVNDMRIDKIPKWQYYYEGMAIAFVDNKYFDAGNATNNLGYAFSITLNPNEPPDDFTKPFRTLKFLPEFVLVFVPNSRMKQLWHDLPPKVIPMKPERQSKKIRLGDDCYCLNNGKNISNIYVTRLAMKWIGVHAVTQYFSQGMSLAGRKCIIDLRIPIGGGNLTPYAQSVMVMLSRHKDDDDWALLHPLWTPGNELERAQTIARMKELLYRDKDLKAELRRVNKIENEITEPELQNLLTYMPDVLDYMRTAE